MNINELERLTGITKQNIRFYEKKELLHPVRNTVNNKKIGFLIGRYPENFVERGIASFSARRTSRRIEKAAAGTERLY